MYFDKKKGYRFTLVNGVKKSLNCSKDEAINIALEYNKRVRYRDESIVETLINNGQYKEPLKPFSQHLDHIHQRILEREQPGKSKADTLRNDIKRAKEFFAKLHPRDIKLAHVKEYIDTYHAEASGNVINRKVSFLQKLFKYGIDDGLMDVNPAAQKLKERTDKKSRRRLDFDSYLAIHEHAPKFLQVAMSLCMQTTHAVNELSRMRYSLKKVEEGVCGCVMLDEPLVQRDPDSGRNDVMIHGTLFIHRLKVQEEETSFVAIPIGNKLKEIIDDSRDGVLSPYIVHRIPDSRSNGIAEGNDHITQLTPRYISTAFSKVRDDLGLYDHLKMDERPTFHEIRALSGFLYKNIVKVNPQKRMAHKDEETTELYTSGHIQWTKAEYAELDIENITPKDIAEAQNKINFSS